MSTVAIQYMVVTVSVTTLTKMFAPEATIVAVVVGIVAVVSTTTIAGVETVGLPAAAAL